MDLLPMLDVNLFFLYIKSQNCDCYRLMAASFLLLAAVTISNGWFTTGFTNRFEPRAIFWIIIMVGAIRLITIDISAPKQHCRPFFLRSIGKSTF